MSTQLRIAAILALIQYLAHAVLFLRAKEQKPSQGREEIELIERMKSLRWNFQGFQRSYWNFYFGYGLLAILWGIIEIVLLWQLAAIAAVSSVSIGPIVATLVAANIAHGVLTLRYFFLVPVVFDVLIAIVLTFGLSK
jgi:hypothetical protein